MLRLRALIVFSWLLSSCAGADQDTESEGSQTATQGTMSTTVSTETVGTGETTGAPVDSITLCTLSEELPHASSWTTRTVVRAAPSGDALYVATSESELRRYIVEDVEGCELTFDADFGVVDVYASSMGVDALGGVYTAHHGSSAGVSRVAPGSEVECEPATQILDLGIDMSGTHGVGRAWDSFVRFDVSGDTCAYTALPGVEIPEAWNGGSVLVDPKGQVHVAVWGELDPDQAGLQDAILRFSPEGESLGVYGNLDAFAEDGFCNVGDMTMCGEDVCVHDFNCWGIKRFTVDGKFVKETETTELRTELDFVETSLAGSADETRVYVAGVYDAGGRAIFRMGL